jgi:hypothetical protein
LHHCKILVKIYWLIDEKKLTDCVEIKFHPSEILNEIACNLNWIVLNWSSIEFLNFDPNTLNGIQI